MSDDLMKTVHDICKVHAQKHGPVDDAVSCDDCGKVATENWPIPIPPFVYHFCESCADKRRDRYYEGPHHELPRAEND